MQNHILTLFFGLITSQMTVSKVNENNQFDLQPKQLKGGPVVTVGPVTDADCDFNTINAAINSGSAEIRMSQEVTFNENIDLSNKNISLIGGYFDCAQASADISTDALTTISGDQTVPVITIDNNNNNFFVYLENIYVTNGKELSNSSGAGLFLSGENTYLSIDHIWAKNNVGSGIGIKNNINSEVLLNDAYFADNIAFDGGGLHCQNTNVIIFGASAIYSNEAIGSGNAVDEGRGGGAYVGSGCSFSYYSGPDQPQLGWNGISWNKSNYHGGGIYAELGGDVYFYGQNQNFRGISPVSDESEPVNMVGNEADANATEGAINGGAIYATGENTTITMRGVNIWGNITPGSGGGVALYDQAILDVNRDPDQACWDNNKCNAFIDNRATASGGAIFAEGGSSVFVRNGWIEGNGAHFGAAVYLSGADTIGLIDGSIFYDNDSLPGADIVSTAIHTLNGGNLKVLFSSVVNHHVDTAVFALFLSEMELYGTLVYQTGNLPIAGQFNGVITAECMYIYDDTEISGIGITVTDVDPFVNRNIKDFHLNDFNLALDACLPHPQSSNYDMDNQLRGWDDPIPDAFGLFDVGADESYLSDVIFENDFEEILN